MRVKNGLCGTVIVAVAVGLSAAGCGSGHGSAAAKTPAPSASSVAGTTAPADPGASSAAASTPSSKDPMIGGDLMALLVDPATLGKGFAVNTKVGSVQGDGSGDSNIADITQADCSKMLHSDWVMDLGMGNVMVLRQYKDGDTQEVTEDFEHFETVDIAQSYMKNAGRLATVCAGRVTDPETQTKVAFKGRSVSGLGNEAYAITETSPAWDNGSTLEAARVGNITVSVFVLSINGKDNGASLATKALTDAAAKLHTAG